MINDVNYYKPTIKNIKYITKNKCKSINYSSDFNDNKSFSNDIPNNLNDLQCNNAKSKFNSIKTKHSLALDKSNLSSNQSLEYNIENSNNKTHEYHKIFDNSCYNNNNQNNSLSFSKTYNCNNNEELNFNKSLIDNNLLLKYNNFSHNNLPRIDINSNKIKETHYNMSNSNKLKSLNNTLNTNCLDEHNLIKKNLINYNEYVTQKKLKSFICNNNCNELDAKKVFKMEENNESFFSQDLNLHTSKKALEIEKYNCKSKSKILYKSPNKRFGMFDEKIGEGQFKKVFRAYDYDNGKEVAWNVITLGDLSDEDVENVQKEILILKKIKHERILNYIGGWFDETKNEVIIITELLTGGSLKQHLNKHGHARIRAIKQWISEILDGLKYLHNKNIIHRDIKCDNIFIDGSNGHIKIGDLGFSCMLKNTDNKAKSLSGTPEFMAPEVLTGKYSIGADIYSFGLCLLEIITLERPYKECNNVIDVFKKLQSGCLPYSLEKVKNNHMKEFIKLCLREEIKRPTANDLLNNCFINDLYSKENDMIATQLFECNAKYDYNNITKEINIINNDFLFVDKLVNNNLDKSLNNIVSNNLNNSNYEFNIIEKQLSIVKENSNVDINEYKNTSNNKKNSYLNKYSSNINKNLKYYLSVNNDKNILNCFELYISNEVEFSLISQKSLILNDLKINNSFEVYRSITISLYNNKFNFNFVDIEILTKHNKISFTYDIIKDTPESIIEELDYYQNLKHAYKPIIIYKLKKAINKIVYQRNRINNFNSSLDIIRKDINNLINNFKNEYLEISNNLDNYSKFVELNYNINNNEISTFSDNNLQFLINYLQLNKYYYNNLN